MANYCYYYMKIKGEKDNVKEFVKVMQCKYNYDKNTFTFDRHMWRVFDANCDLDDEDNELEYSDDGKLITYINGNCAWSAYCCMMEGSGSYYDDYKNDITRYRATSLIKESKNLLLDIELYSEECGEGFQEHIYISNGEVIIDETLDYEEVSYYCYEDDDEAEEALETLNNKYNTNYSLEDLKSAEHITFGGYEEWNFSF